MCEYQPHSKTMQIVAQTSSQPNPGNTRLDSQNPSNLDTACGLDWLDFRGLLCPTKITDLFDWVADHCDDIVDWDVDRPTGRHKRFSHGFRSVRGGIYAYEPTEGAYHVWISLPGQALAGCGSTMAQLFVANACVSAGLRCTRLDIYLDDWTGRLIKIRGDIKEAYLQGQHSGFEKMHEDVSYDNWQQSPKATLYVGSRQSTSFTRIYDKDDRVRWERQTGRDIADTVLADLLRVHEEARRVVPLSEYDAMIASVICSHLTNGITFLERKDKNLARGVTCQFWSDFVAWLGSLQNKVTRNAPPPTLERTLQWLDRQVSKSLSLVRDVLGYGYAQWIAGILEEGRKRYKAIDEKKIELYRVSRKFQVAT